MRKPGRPIGSKTKRMSKIEVERFVNESVNQILDNHMSWTEYTTWCRKHGVSEHRANHLWKSAWVLIQEKFELDRHKQVAKHLQKYWLIHDIAQKRGDLNTARQALNDIAKLMGLNEPDKVDVTEKIRFNFGDDTES
jgi:hypothetical protein